MRNSNTLHNVACPKCGSAEKFEVEVRARATLVDNGAESYVDPMWEDDAGTTCTNCGFIGTWHDFNVELPHSVCTGCNETIRWNGKEWLNSDLRSSCTLTTNHAPKWLTLGELRDRTAHLPDWLPITADGVELGVGDWTNLHLFDVPESADHMESTSLILGQTDDFDTRQW